MSETDGIEEAFEGQLRVLVTAASQIGERYARGREAALRTAAARSEQEYRELQSRFAAERQAARAQLTGVHSPQWWDNAKPEDISAVWQTAKSWSNEEPEAVRAEQRIAQEVQNRYGISADALYAQVEKKRAAQAAAPKFSVYEFVNDADSSRSISKEEALKYVEGVDADRVPNPQHRGDWMNDIPGWKGKDPDVDRALAAKFPQYFSEEELAAIRTGRAAAERERAAAEEAEAQRLMQHADQEDRRAAEGKTVAEQSPAGEEQQRAAAEAAERSRSAAAAREQGQGLYDSAERRRTTAEDLESQGVDAEVVATRMRADVSHGKPATEAVASNTKRRSPKARKKRGRAPQAQRTGQGR